MATLTLTPFSDWAPVPRIRAVIRDAHTSAVAVNVYASTGGPARLVRGGAGLPAASVIVLDDFLAPLNVPVLYRVDLLDAAGFAVESIEQTAPALVYYGTIVQHIIDPSRAVEVRLLASSQESLEWQHDGELIRPGSTRQPTWLGAGRWPLQGVPLAFGTETAEQEAAMRSLFALDEDGDYLPIIVVRTSHPVRWPQPFQAVVPSLRVQGLDWLAGGHTTHWHATASEVRPPGAALVRAAVTWDDVAAVHATWEAVRVTYPTWADLMTDAALAGAANA